MRAAREFQSSVSALPSPLPARACEKGGENAERTQTRSRPRSLAATLAALPSIVAEPISSIRMSPLVIKISKDFATLWTTTAFPPVNR